MWAWLTWWRRCSPSFLVVVTPNIDVLSRTVQMLHETKQKNEQEPSSYGKLQQIHSWDSRRSVDVGMFFSLFSFLSFFFAVEFYWFLFEKKIDSTTLSARYSYQYTAGVSYHVQIWWFFFRFFFSFFFSYFDLAHNGEDLTLNPTIVLLFLRSMSKKVKLVRVLPAHNSKTKLLKAVS